MKSRLLLWIPCGVMLLNLQSSIGRGVDGNQSMARIAFFGILIFWLFLIGTPSGWDLQGFLLKYLGHLIYLFLHTCRFWMESFMAVSAFLPFSSLFTFGSGGIVEVFLVPFLLWICMCFPFVFVFRFLILMTATILHSKCMHFWAFDFVHIDELVLLLC
jgi:hypothetical protein